MIEYCYLFWSHDENGPKNLVATMDRECLPTLCKQQENLIVATDRSPKNGWFAQIKEQDGVDIMEKLATLLKISDKVLLSQNNGVHKLWGGFHLQVIKLFQSEGTTARKIAESDTQMGFRVKRCPTCHFPITVCSCLTGETP